MSNLSLRLATASDYDEYYQIRAEKNNLFWTGYENAPDFISFKGWYLNRLDDPSRNIYLVREDNEVLGALNIDIYPDYVFIGYSTLTKASGKGVASYMVSQVEKIISNQKEIKSIKAWINSQNIASIKVCTKNGFQHSGITENRNRFGKMESYQLMIKHI